MSDDIAAARAILVDHFDRIRELVVELTDGLTVATATYRPDPEANTIAWLIWHLTRIQDDHIAGLARVDQVWPGWRERIGVPFDDQDTGYGHDADDVDAVRVGGEALAGYHGEVDALTRRYLAGLDAAELSRVVDTRWDPPVTVSIRLVSVVGDALQHLGQAGYLRGLAQRAH